MATFVSFKTFITLPRVIRAFKSISKVFKAVKKLPSYSRALSGKSRLGGQIDVSANIKSNLKPLKKNGRKA